MLRFCRTSARLYTSHQLSGFSANWHRVSDAIDYRLDVSTTNTFATYVYGYQDLSVGNVTSFPLTGLIANTTHYYRVRAFNGSATSTSSNVKNVEAKPH